MRFDANVSILYPDVPLLDRPAAAAAAGFDAIEMWWPFEQEVPAERDVDDLVEAVAGSGLRLVALNLTAGDRSAGEHGLVVLSGERARFRDNVDVAVAMAGRLGGQVLNALYGNPPTDVDPGRPADVAVENLAFAAERAAAVGARVALEALNPVDFPRYGLQRIETAIDLADLTLAQAGASIGIIFDVYNVQRSEGDVIARIHAYVDRFSHVQIADVPARLHPGTGEIAFERVLPSLEDAGYDGYVGLEYHPSPDPADTFAWLAPALRRSRPDSTRSSDLVGAGTSIAPSRKPLG